MIMLITNYDSPKCLKTVRDNSLVVKDILDIRVSELLRGEDGVEVLDPLGHVLHVSSQVGVDDDHVDPTHVKPYTHTTLVTLDMEGICERLESDIIIYLIKKSSHLYLRLLLLNAHIKQTHNHFAH